MSAVDVILCIVSALFPLVGLILFIVKKEKKFGIAALIGLGVEIVLGAIIGVVVGVLFAGAVESGAIALALML